MSHDLDCSPIVLAHEEPFTVGSAEFRPSTREVLFGGRHSVVEPRVMQLLVALYRANGAVVAKGDLAIMCWNGRIVGEDAINRVVSRLRSVAQRDAGGEFRIETITKVGYRLVASAQAARQPAPGSPPVGKVRSALSRRDLIIAGGAIAAAAGAGLMLLTGDSTPREARLLISDARQSIREGAVDRIGNAIGKLRQAVQIAPDSADAWGLLAFAYMASANHAPASKRADLRFRGTAAIKRAFALDRNQADALAATVWATPQYRNWYNFEMSLRAALAQHPDHAVLICTLAYQLSQVGRTNEALAHYDRGLEAFPLSPGLRVAQAMCLWDLGRLDEADSAINAAFELTPRYYGTWFIKLYFLMYEGRAGEASAMIADSDQRPLGIPEWNYDLTRTQVEALQSRDPGKIMRTVEMWKSEAVRGTGFIQNAAIFAAFVGDGDEAFRLLNGLYFNRGFTAPDAYFAKEQGKYSGPERHTHTLFRRPIASIRHDPRFGRLTRELGLDDYWRRTNSRALVTA